MRAYDPSANQWTTPDAYAGDVHDPMSQKPYMWNNNNAMAYSDPTGYAPLFRDASREGDAAEDPKQVHTEDSAPPLMLMIHAAARAYLDGPVLPSGGLVRPGTQTVSELAENADNYLVKSGASTTESSSDGRAALQVAFGNGQTGQMIFSAVEVEIEVNDRKGNEIVSDYSEVRWQWDPGNYGRKFVGGYPEYRMVNAGIKTWLPAPLQSDVEPKE